MRRSLIFFWKTHLAVAAAAAAAAAVVVGAFVMGDSARGSLRQLALEGLGRIDHALLSEHFFRAELSDHIHADMQGRLGAEAHAAPALLTGGAVSAADTGERAAGVQIVGVDQRFLSLYEGADGVLDALSEDGIPPPAVLNAPLAAELNVQVGSEIALYAASRSGAHPENILGDRGTDRRTASLRARVALIVPSRGIGRLSLRPNQTAPFNLFVKLDRLQRALDQPGRANLIGAALPGGERALEDVFEESFRARADLTDVGLTVRSYETFFVVESPHFAVGSALEKAALKTAADLNLSAQPNMLYVVNQLEVNGRTIPYSTAAGFRGVGGEDAPPFPPLLLTDGSPAPPLDAEGAYLNAWAAEDLQAKAGDSLRARYFMLEGSALVEKEAHWTVRGVVSMSDAAVHPAMTPEIPGLGESDNLNDWEATFPLQREWIRPKDEAYWDRYRASPKAFLSMESARQLWSSQFGEATSVWVEGGDEELAQFRRRLTANMSVPLRPVRETAVKASAGSTDFAGLFAGFSMFLIASSALLVGLLFRLGVESRSSEAGLLLALGFTPKTVRRRFLAEGLVLSAVGAAVGAAGAYLYAYAMLSALQTWWRPAVGDTFLSLHWSWRSCAAGWLLSTCAALAAVAWGSRHLSRVSVRALTSGASFSAAFSAASFSASRFRRPLFSYGLTAAGALLWLFSDSPALFFASGCCLLAGGTGLFRAWLRRPRSRAVRVGVSDARRNPSRAVASAALVACACFVLVAVGANRRPMEIDDSATGGYALTASSDAPIYVDLNDPGAQFDLGANLGADVRIMPLRSSAGEDASCLNLYRPQEPRLLGVSDAFIERGGFQFEESLAQEDETNPWRLLRGSDGLSGESGAVPAVADIHSARWILHKKLGEELTIENERGETARIRLVGFLKTSVFQSDLIVSEAALLRHFPSRGGYGRFLIESPESDPSETARELEHSLRRYGFDAVASEDLLKRFHTVEETYLSAFQTLGGLGLLLGIVGLAVTQLRNALERRAELALLLSLGFRRGQLIRAASLENAFVLLVGMAIGSGAALFASAPQIRSAVWTPLALTLLLVFFAGALSGAAAWYAALARKKSSALLPVLKGAQ